jgi:glyoxylase-like metal-dependent hydrolase (beta-lactamase superfamily II)
MPVLARSCHAVLSAALLALAACGKPAEKAPAQPAAPSIKLYALDCGRVRVADADEFADNGAFKGKTVDMVDPCYLIRHPKGDLLWDTGVPQAIHDQPNGIVDGNYHVTVPRTLTDQLAELKLTPADIDYLSLSHSHFDHIGNAALFDKATWIVDADERVYIFRPEARKNVQDFAAKAPLERFRTEEITGEADRDVFGDGSVTIVQAPGHTPGHAVLLVRLAKAGPVLLAGDMWHLAESRAQRTVPSFNTDRARTLASMDKVEALAKATGARVVRQHVAEDFAALPKFPAALE